MPRAERFTDWVPAMLQRRLTDAPGEGAVLAAADAAIAEMRASGTGFVGDISNSLVTVEPLRRSTLDGVVFHEVLKLAADAADEVLEGALRAQEAHGTTGRFPVSLAPHAPYSVSPQTVPGAARGAGPDAVSALVGSPGRVTRGSRAARLGDGPLASVVGTPRGMGSRTGRRPACSPVRYLEQMRVLDSRLLAVHVVECGDDDLDVLRARGTTVVTCPRSNRYVGVGDPPATRFYRSGVAVAVGTDSLASNDDLNLFSELAALRRLAPSVPAAMLLDSATLVGARALGLETAAGTIEPGKLARLIAVALPPEVVDVEEYLVSGVTPDRVHWVEDLIADCGFADRA